MIGTPFAQDAGALVAHSCTRRPRPTYGERDTTARSFRVWCFVVLGRLQRRELGRWRGLGTSL
ncbi:hypothetical protein CH063_14651 [Colletotrichum higginsianum]|uniref:Uncharacterized protein n=1 Tax=Colletotrichum higginsianum (strain IMI 349063) TaxID=759273 RepID=H1VZH0_COLHI|nr:hypothetical protein CH063_14651 [Colletotrichum higginsianum]